MSKETIRGVPETMLQTLYARARETQTGRGYIRDEKAVEIVAAMDYDFSSAHQDKAMSTGVVARTILLDRMVEEFLRAHPGTTVVNIACGLDTRCYRMAGLFAQWYNLDLPETMDIRRRFLQESDTVHQIACSAMNAQWTQAVPATDGPVLVIIEGLTMYLKEADVQQLFSILSKKFHSLTVFVEVMSPWVAGHVKEKSIEGSSAKFTWGVRSGSELAALVPPFRSLGEHSLTEGMSVFLPIYKVLGKIPCVRNISNKILVLEK